MRGIQKVFICMYLCITGIIYVKYIRRNALRINWRISVHKLQSEKTSNKCNCIG